MQTQPLHAPCWFELATTDQTAAKRFYSELLGWTTEDHPIDDGSAYTIFRLDGREVAACYTQMPEQTEQGVPPHWAVYFKVADCDASVAKIKEAGGQVFCEPFEVMEHLRMAIIGDAEGAAFCVMQPRQHHGVEVIHSRHAITWVELATRDIRRAEAFYAEVFGWSFQDHAGTPGGYRVFSVDGQPQGGLMQMNEQWGDMPSHWAIYLQVDDVDATLARAVELGGAICVPAFDAPNVGRIGMFTDPAGAGAYVIKLLPQPG